MVQLKQVQLRLKSIKNIQKITKTMKMVSASKFMRAERELQAARPFGDGPRKFYESSHLVKGPVDVKDDKKEPPPAPPEPVVAKPDEKEAVNKLRRLYIAMTSDRGLCGGVHSGVSKRIRREMTARNAEGPTHKLVCIGDKSRTMLRRAYAAHMLVSVKDIGRIPPVFADASVMAAAIADSGYTYDIGEIFYNKYFSAVKYELSVMPFFNKYRIEIAPNINAFDDVDEDQLECYAEWTLAALIYYALKEGVASEQSARMAAMDNASKNASDMIRKLTLLFNRTRQAVITRELIEIISGAAALKLPGTVVPLNVLYAKANRLVLPTVRINPPVKEYYAGDRIDLQCVAQGSPQPSISWQRASRRALPLSSQQYEQMFIIESAREEDSGEYRCIASNDVGSSDSVAVITVRPRPSRPQRDRLVVQPTAPSVNEGQSARLVCTGSINVPAGTIDWVRKDGDRFEANVRSDNGVLYIDGAMLSNAGVYVCQTHGAQVDPEPVLLTVVPLATLSPAEAPEVVVNVQMLSIPSGGSDKIDCHPRGTPAPLIRWSKHEGHMGAGVSQRGNTLIFNEAEDSDAGYYVCEGIDRVNGRVVHFVYLYVDIEKRQKPVVEVRPGGEQPVALGNTQFEFQCIVLNGIPAPDVTWSRAGGRALSAHVEIKPNNILRYTDRAAEVQESFQLPSTQGTDIYLGVSPYLHPGSGPSRGQSSRLKGNLPLVLTCGHSNCENCIRSRLRIHEPIECKICHRRIQLNERHFLTLAHDDSYVYRLFPVNHRFLGELTMQLMQKSDEPQAPLGDWIALHEENRGTLEAINHCKIHEDQQRVYYCTVCLKTVCAVCLLFGSDKSCKDHNLQYTSEIFQIEMPIEVSETDGEETVSTLSVSESDPELPELEPMPTKPMHTDTEIPSVSRSSMAVECAQFFDVIDFKTSNNRSVSEWASPDSVHRKEFLASVTCIDNAGIIYLRGVEQEGACDQIHEALNAKCQNLVPKAKCMKWSIEEPYIALYQNNIVMKVVELTPNCIVHYVDYCYEYICSFANMRESTELHQIPIQAHKCVFSDIKPIGNQWDTDTLDYIRESIVGKNCSIKVAGNPINGITPINMRFKNLRVNDQLVDLHLAKYADDCKERKLTTPTSSEQRFKRTVLNITVFSVILFILCFFIIYWNFIKAEESEDVTGNITFPIQLDNEYKRNIEMLYERQVFPHSIIHDVETKIQ